MTLDTENAGVVWRQFLLTEIFPLYKKVPRFACESLIALGECVVDGELDEA
jgi:hypothetical protein